MSNAGRNGLLLLLAITAACGGSPPKTPTPTPTPAAVIGPRAVLPSGAVYSIELASTPEEQAQGLMYRESLPERYGMFFPFTDGGAHRFWMKNTMIPLDIIWLDGAGRVVFVSANTPPCKADPCPTYGPDAPVASVLELAAGMAEREKVTVGTVIRFEEIK